MINVRPIATFEWKEYRDVRLRALKDSPGAFGSAWEIEALRNDEAWAKITQENASGQNGRGLFALEGNLICGLAWCLISDKSTHVAHIYGMWADPAVRGQGVGRALLTESIAWAKSKGTKHIRLGVTVAESPAMQMYRSQGFYPVGNPELLREGSDLMAQEMELNLCESTWPQQVKAGQGGQTNPAEKKAKDCGTVTGGDEMMAGEIPGN